jgi:hypothetical protein
MKKINDRMNRFILVFFVLAIGIFLISCNNQNIDLINNEEQKREAFNQILNNPALHSEFMMEMRNNREAMNRTLQDRDFTNNIFNPENIDFMREHNPGMDTMMIDNVRTRIQTDTVFQQEFNRRMEILPGPGSNR